MSLSDKQRRFCEEYVIDLNGAQAAIRSGYSEKTAKEQASRLLTNVNIKDYISRLQEDIKERNKITVDECVSILANIARADLVDFYNEDGSLKPIHEISKEARMAIAEITTHEEFDSSGKLKPASTGLTRKLKTLDRRSAVVELMKHLGGYKADNHQKGLVILPSQSKQDIVDELKGIFSGSD